MNGRPTGCGPLAMCDRKLPVARGLLLGGRALGARCRMKNSHSVKGQGREKVKKAKKALKITVSTNIAQRYMELRRLRAELSKAEAARNSS